MPAPPLEVPPRRPLLSRLALRTAAITAVAATVASFLVLVGTGAAWGAAPLVGLVAGAAAYAVVHTLVARRLELAGATLRQARQRQFEALARLQLDRGRDELDDLLRQVYQAGRVLQQEIEWLEQLENYRRDFLGNVSHELKTPIFVISGFAEQLLDGALEDPRVNRRFIEKIGRNADRLGHLARDLLSISKIESGELRMHRVPFAFKPLVAEVLEALEPVAEKRRVTLLDGVRADLPRVVGDRDQLRHVLMNLVDNAIKYNHEGGRVEVAARYHSSPRPGVRVVVADDGLGIPQEALPRITERFYRVDRSRSRQQGGTGLGLAIVKHVLEAHGERLRVESKPGYGSAFSFGLPVEAEEPAATTGPTGGGAPPTEEGAGKKG